MKPYKGHTYIVYMDNEWINRVSFLEPLKDHQIERYLKAYAKDNDLDWRKLKCAPLGKGGKRK